MKISDAVLQRLDATDWNASQSARDDAMTAISEGIREAIASSLTMTLQRPDGSIIPALAVVPPAALLKAALSALQAPMVEPIMEAVRIWLQGATGVLISYPAPCPTIQYATPWIPAGTAIRPALLACTSHTQVWGIIGTALEESCKTGVPTVGNSPAGEPQVPIPAWLF